eukprot:6117897-Pyramimonas_sp.AAC.1
MHNSARADLAGNVSLHTRVSFHVFETLDVEMRAKRATTRAHALRNFFGKGFCKWATWQAGARAD